MELKKLFAMATIPALALVLTACGGKKDAPKPTDKPAATAASSPIEVTAQQYFADFKKDAKAAEAKYSGKPIKLSGTVRDIMDGTQGMKTDSAILMVGDPKDDILGNVAATVTNDKLAEIKKLKKGDKITVTCTGTNNPVMAQCLNSTIVK